MATLDMPRPPLRWLGVVVRLSVLGSEAVT
jgi:hypothetical protein